MTSPDPSPLSEYVSQLAAFARRRLRGEYEVDEFGYDADFTTRVLLPPLRTLLHQWLRADVRGLENLPTDSGALLVANHSGTVAIDAVMVATAVAEHFGPDRPLRMLGADFVFRTPILGALARKTGSTLACPEDAARLLAANQLVAAFPEGFKGVGKPFSQRYRLQRFGRGGFVSTALRAGVPIIPTAIVGAEEAYPLLGSIQPLARLLGIPYFPITPLFPHLGLLGMVPLPSKWIIEFGQPIDLGELGSDAADDPWEVFNLADRVRENIQQALYRLLADRGHPFLD